MVSFTESFYVPPSDSVVMWVPEHHCGLVLVTTLRIMFIW